MTSIGVKASRSLSLGHRICSEVHLETTTGLLVGRTTTRSTVVWTSFRSATQALVFDEDGDVILVGPLGTYTPSSSARGHQETTDIWTDSLPPDLARAASTVAIVYSWNPSWLAALAPRQLRLEELQRLLVTSRMGDVAIGGKLRRPHHEPPWARWPNGEITPPADPFYGDPFPVRATAALVVR